MEGKVVVSACLLGQNCRYDGGSNLVPQVKVLADRGLCVPVCPEELGGLPTPRTPCELRKVDGKTLVLARDGRDCTAHFALGAEKALATAKENGCAKAILKSRSPSCGKGKVYDGTFSKTLVDGHGLFARLLVESGFQVLTEEEFAANPALLEG